MQNIPVNDNEELNAINDMLAAIGEPAVLTLDENNSDVSNAQRILQRVNRRIQSKGWVFNLNEQAVLTPDVRDRRIRWLPSYLKVHATGSAYVQRNGYVYDLKSDTDVYPAAIQVTLLRLVPYEEMPVCFRDYIVAVASREFNSKFFGSIESAQELEEQVAELWAQCNEYEMDVGEYNALDGDTFVQGIAQR